ncbi:polysaccharide deacetylase family protein [Rhizohabitans arisaemae]|uniref:polysaccharide deacetylase family protein n=1 Tax=Rhizohabitans arisaemae TaxID=2720610 RepID=UPI0024B1AFC7|nr:polysaccharide deacetylase family protein [Rhizohabitans arisaemae]
MRRRHLVLITVGALLGTLQALPATAEPSATPAAAQPSAVRTVVALTFDDGTADHAKVAQMLTKRGMKGTFYVNSGRLDRPGRLTTKQVLDIAKAGHEIGGHTVNHVRLPNLNEVDQETEICEDRRALLDLGLKVRSFAYPFGAFDETSKQLAMQCGYITARGVGGVRTPAGCTTCPVTEKIPPGDFAYVRTASSARQGRGADVFKDAVVQTERNGGGLVAIVFHRVDESKGTYVTTPKALGEFLDWLRARKSKGTTVQALGDVVGGRLWPVPDDVRHAAQDRVLR